MEMWRFAGVVTACAVVLTGCGGSKAKKPVLSAEQRQVVQSDEVLGVRYLSGLHLTLNGRRALVKAVGGAVNRDTGLAPVGGGMAVGQATAGNILKKPGSTTAGLVAIGLEASAEFALRDSDWLRERVIGKIILPPQVEGRVLDEKSAFDYAYRYTDRRIREAAVATNRDLKCSLWCDKEVERVYALTSRKDPGDVLYVVARTFGSYRFNRTLVRAANDIYREAILGFPHAWESDGAASWSFHIVRNFEIEDGKRIAKGEHRNEIKPKSDFESKDARTILRTLSGGEGYTYLGWYRDKRFAAKGKVWHADVDSTKPDAIRELQ